MSNSSFFNKQVLLSTAIIKKVKNTEGNFIPLRVLLDSGSQNNFTTKECIDLLQLKGKKVDGSVFVINDTILNIKQNAITTIANAYKSFIYTFQFFIAPKIISLTPARYLNISNLVQVQKFI